MKAQIITTLTLALGLTITCNAVAFEIKGTHDQSCLNCHKDNGANYNHDNEFYESRSLAGTKLKNHADLKAQINRCSNFYDSAWFPEEEAEIVKYVNDEYYQFIMNAVVVQASNLH
ncbi:hypothetical protein MNB_SUP05-4-404 [hydrothermal vent metagenome]|uniref:Cytochrome c domain-containing protein n=1 Tax=hydrothermal vent metagenome TaxID=652676 RepID=A0A1W1D830_9ZZZZ